MSRALKFLAGLAAVAAMGWAHHGPLGNGERLIDRIEGQARQAVAATDLPGIEVRLGRDPLSRLATLSGTADAFQREGQGSLKGINDHVRDIAGISAIRWADEPAKTAVPLFAELLVQLVAAYLAGLAIAWLLFGRRRREGFY